MKILFIGTSEFAVQPLSILLKNSFHVDTVITQPDKKGGRGKKFVTSPVKQLAEKYNIKILQPENINSIETINYIRMKNYDIGILVSYGQIIKKEVFQLPKYNIINLHPSLLPKYRGPSPIQSALLNGEKTTGNTIMKISDKMDAGDIIAQEIYYIKASDDYSALHDRLSEKGGNLLINVLENFKKNNIVYLKQNEEEATYCRLITKKYASINWEQSSNEILNKIKALCKWPVAYTYLNSNILKIYKADIYKNGYNTEIYQSGTIIKFSKKSFGVVCGDKKILQILQLQLQGKKILDASSFLNGIRLNTGDTLGH